MQQFYLDEYIEEIMPELSQYRYGDEDVRFSIGNGDDILVFSSFVDQVGPESWDVVIEIFENGECIYEGLNPSWTVQRLCEKYDGILFEEIEE